MNYKDLLRRAKYVFKHVRKLSSGESKKNLILEEKVVIWLFIAFHRQYIYSDMMNEKLSISKNEIEDVYLVLYNLDLKIREIYKEIYIDLNEFLSIHNRDGFNAEQMLSSEFIATLLYLKGNLKIKHVGGQNNLWRRWWQFSFSLTYRYFDLNEQMRLIYGTIPKEYRNTSGKSWVDLSSGDDTPKPWEINSDFRRFRN